MQDVHKRTDLKLKYFIRSCFFYQSNETSDLADILSAIDRKCDSENDLKNQSISHKNQLTQESARILMLAP